MWEAIEIDDHATVAELVKSGFPPESTRPFGNESLLQYAYEKNAKQAFAVLANADCGVEMQLRDGTQIIHRVAYDKDPFWLQTLVESGADVDAWSNGRGNREGSPIHFAIIEGCQDNGVFLLESGACIDCPSNQFSSTAFFHAVNHYQWKVATRMLQLGADPEHGPFGKRVVDALKQRDLDSERSFMEGFPQFVYELKKTGHGKEVFQGSLWTKKSYEDFLSEGEALSPK